MNKFCVVSCSNFLDKKNKELIDKTSHLNKKYCDTNGYDYKFDLIDDKCDCSFGLFVKYKFKTLSKYSNDYDYVLFIDGDAMFNNPTRKLEELIDDDHEFFSYQHSLIVGNTIWPIKIGDIFKYTIEKEKISYFKNTLLLDKMFKNQLGYSFLNQLATITLNPMALNGGFMLFKTTNRMKNLFDKAFSICDLFVDKSVDEGCIGLILQSKEYEDCYKIFDSSFAGNSALSYQPEFYYNEEKNFIVHNCGQSIDSKLNSVEIVKNNKWWKEFLKNN